MVTRDLYEFKNDLEVTRNLLSSKTDRQRANIFYVVCKEIRFLLRDEKKKNETGFSREELEDIATFLTEEMKSRTTIKKRSEGLYMLLDKMEREQEFGSMILMPTWVCQIVDYMAR